MIRNLGNTLYVQTEGTYLRLENEGIVLEAKEQDPHRVPLLHIGGLCVFGNVMVSPPLIHHCSDSGRSLVWFDRNGRFRGRLRGKTSGNVLLRVQQFEARQDRERVLQISKSFVRGKIRSQRTGIARAGRDRSDLSVDESIRRLDSCLDSVDACTDADELRGIEGQSTVIYFEQFSSMLNGGHDYLRFHGRSRRPPKDPINALLSFSYSLLANDCVSALEGVGLDPQMGFFHSLRPGRPSLGLDLMEEFRVSIADRAVLALVNRNQLRKRDFEQRSGGIYLTAGGRKKFLVHWQDYKMREINHRLLRQNVPFGLLPHVQARLLARWIRGDIPEYRCFERR